MWITGPNLPLELANSSGMCGTAVNSTTVIFVGIDNNVIIYDFQYAIWKYLPKIVPWNMEARACTTVLDKHEFENVNIM